MPASDVDQREPQIGTVDTDDSAGTVETLMGAMHVLTALSTDSLMAFDDVVTLAQYRVLRLLQRLRPANLATLAQALGVHPSSATRICDRLVSSGLVSRAEDDSDRRTITLDLTSAGEAVVAGVAEQRRAALGAIVRRMPAEARADLDRALGAFLLAAETR